MVPIGYANTDTDKVPRHYTISREKGTLNIHDQYIDGLKDIEAGERIVVIFLFHKSPEFTMEHLFQKASHHKKTHGVFSICSPLRPNPIGMSVLEVLKISGGRIEVSGIDMVDGTPILDIKPCVKEIET
jgi:tRNA (adenine37-N6)-methyltransferase